MQKITSGPWKYRVLGNTCALYLGNVQRPSFEIQSGAYDAHGEANAKAIHALPDCLEALAELVTLMQGVIDGDYKPDSFTLQPARAALAKAGY